MNFFIILLFLLSIKPVKWNFYDGDRKYIFKFYQGHRFLIVIYVNEEIFLDSVQKIWYKLKKLIKEPYVIGRDIKLVWVNTTKRPFIKNHYDLEDKNYFFLFIQGNMARKFEGFNEIIHQDDLYETCMKFVKDNINPLTIELEDIDQFKIRMKNEKLICVYFGNDSDNYRKYFNFILAELQLNKHKFYISFDKSLRDLISKKYNFINEENKNKDMVVFFRDESLLNKFDTKKAVVYTDFYSSFQMRKKYEVERFPKMRDCDNLDTTLFPVIHLLHPVLIYLRGKEKNEENLKSFEEAVMILKKRLIFTVCDYTNKETWDIYETYLFKRRLPNFNGGEIIIFVYKNLNDPSKSISHIMQNPINVDNIIEFARLAFKHHFKFYNVLENQENTKFNIDYTSFNML